VALIKKHSCPPNRYEVLKKRKAVLDDMSQVITERFVDKNANRVQCGIVYCFSRNDCEKVAQELRGTFNKPGKPRLNIR